MFVNQVDIMIIDPGTLQELKNPPRAITQYFGIIQKYDPAIKTACQALLAAIEDKDLPARVMGERLLDFVRTFLELRRSKR